MNKYYIVAYFSTTICFITSTVFATLAGTTRNSLFLILSILAAIFPIIFYYYVTIPVIGKAYNKLSKIRKRKGSFANFFAIFGNMLASILPFNIVSRDMLVALVN